MELQIGLNAILQAGIGLLIAIIAWFAKQKINNIEIGIKNITDNFNEYKDQQVKECSEKRKEIYNDFYKQDLLDERKMNIECRLTKVEGKLNGNSK